MKYDVIGNARDRQRVTVDATGRGEIILTVPPDQIWEYERLVVRCASTVLTPNLRIYEGSEDDSNLVDGADNVTLAIEDSASPVRFSPGSDVRFVVTGADVGVTFQVNGQRVIKSPVDKSLLYNPRVPVEATTGRSPVPETGRVRVRRPFGGGW